MPLMFLMLTAAVFTTVGARRVAFARQRTPESSLPPTVSSSLPTPAIVRASVRLGKTTPERWFIAYDQGTRARVALFEGSMVTDDRAFLTNRNLGHKLSLQNLQSISIPGADTSFLLSFDQNGDKTAKYFCVVTFASGALDIKLVVTTVSGKAEILDNPFRVRVWSKLPSASPDAERYDISEYGLPNINATKLVKVRNETKSMK